MDSTTGHVAFARLQELSPGAMVVASEVSTTHTAPVEATPDRHRVRDHFRKLIRYAAVSVVSTTVSLSILGFFIATRAISPGWANVVATSVATIPSFELNRRWVWKKAGQRSLLAEVGPFCAMSFIGLALSTVAVSVAAHWATSHGFGTTGRTVIAEAANVSTFGLLWLAQYAILDRLLFRTAPSAIPITGQF